VKVALNLFERSLVLNQQLGAVSCVPKMQKKQQIRLLIIEKKTKTAGVHTKT
jgi:hypothetical protein